VSAGAPERLGRDGVAPQWRDRGHVHRRPCGGSRDGTGGCHWTDRVTRVTARAFRSRQARPAARSDWPSTTSCCALKKSWDPARSSPVTSFVFHSLDALEDLPIFLGFLSVIFAFAFDSYLDCLLFWSAYKY